MDAERDKRHLDIGEKRVRVSFNPSQDDRVTKIKLAGAKLINEIYTLIDIEDERDAELERLVNKAMEEAESATTWAVKAATLYK